MFLFTKKKNTTTEKARASQPNLYKYKEFIPYYAHYNPHTLLTKNGELLQTIKIATNNRGLDYEGGGEGDITVRDAIRNAIISSTPDDKFAFWIHTMRKRHPVNYKTQFKEPLAAYVQERWQKKNPWKYQYYNEIYVTILYDGQSAELYNSKWMTRILLPKKNRQFRRAYLDESYEKLDRVALSMLESIRTHYQAHRLSIVERVPSPQEMPINQAIFYSEPMEFLGTLLNLRSEPFPLPDGDLSTALTTSELTLGFNALETKNLAGKKRFSAILTLKHYREVPPETSDHVLQLPMELIISQAFHYTTAQKALQPYKEQHELFEISEDTEAIGYSGIAEMMQSNTNNPLDFGEQQTSIMVISDDYKMLDSEVTTVQSAFVGPGLITVREDIKLEECFWSQMPGNFEFLRRRNAISTSRIGGFCRLNRFPVGTDTGNHWGQAVSLMPTMVKAPYFFNFHYQDNGHTVLFDFNSFRDNAGNILLNFLLTQARKFDGKLYIFDRNHSAQLFLNKMEAQYHNLDSASGTQGALSLNPFTLENTPRNQSFLLAWCSSAISPDMVISPEQKECLRNAIAAVYNAPPEQRNLNTLIQQLRTTDADLAQTLSGLQSSKWARLLGADNESLDLTKPVHGFDMSALVKKQELVPLFSYLMHRIISTLDGKPTIIVLHEAWDLLENAFFAPRLESLLEMLQQNNVMVILTTQKPTDKTETTTFQVTKKFPTQIFVPDDISVGYASLGVI